MKKKREGKKKSNKRRTTTTGRRVGVQNKQLTNKKKGRGIKWCGSEPSGVLETYHALQFN